MTWLLDLLVKGLSRVHRGIAAARKRRGARVACGEGCYSLSEDTLVPLGDLGVGPTEYSIRP